MTVTIPSSALPFSANAQFFGSQVPQLGPNNLKVAQCEFAHDTAVMQFWADDVNSTSYSSGMPMSLTFGTSTVKRTFYGYVNHSGRINNALSGVSSLTARNSTVITCVGASYFMKQAGTQTFPSQTASQTVAAVAAMFGLDANIVPDSTVWPAIQMAGMSYWQLCVMLAKRIGYTFYCSGIQLVFKPRQTDPTNLLGFVASYDYRNDPASFPIFTPTFGANSPSGGQLANRQLAGINPRTNQVVYAQVSGSPTPTLLGAVADAPLFNHTEHCTVNSQQEAQSKVNGAGASNQLYITASATAVGNPVISQGSLVYVANANGSQNGLWFVEQAVQTMDTGTYATALSLGRDSRGAAAMISSSIQIASAPTAALVAGKWVAA